jgi:hypothetical protein
LTANDLHDEDSVANPDRIREQVLALAFQIGGGLQPPFSEHQAALDALRPAVAAAYRDIASVLGSSFSIPQP